MTADRALSMKETLSLLTSLRNAKGSIESEIEVPPPARENNVDAFLRIALNEMLEAQLGVLNPIIKDVEGKLPSTTNLIMPPAEFWGK